MVLEAVYEEDFLSCSHGFRPGRSAHQALRQLSGVIAARRQHWVLDVDLRKYFDSIPHSHLREILNQRVTDSVIRRMIDKWLNAGVLEAGNLHFATEGTRKAVSSHQCSRTFSCTMCWTSGLRTWCDHA